MPFLHILLSSWKQKEEENHKGMPRIFTPTVKEITKLKRGTKIGLNK
jgi:hypothetical protein